MSPTKSLFLTSSEKNGVSGRHFDLTALSKWPHCRVGLSPDATQFHTVKGWINARNVRQKFRPTGTLSFLAQKHRVCWAGTASIRMIQRCGSFREVLEATAKQSAQSSGSQRSATSTVIRSRVTSWCFPTYWLAYALDLDGRTIPGPFHLLKHSNLAWSFC